jgi:hypothetical protein
MIWVLNDPLHKGQLVLCFFQALIHYLWKYFEQVGHFSKICYSFSISMKQIEHYVSDLRSTSLAGIVYYVSENLFPSLLIKS